MSPHVSHSPFCLLLHMQSLLWAGRGSRREGRVMPSVSKLMRRAGIPQWWSTCRDQPGTRCGQQSVSVGMRYKDDERLGSLTHRHLLTAGALCLWIQTQASTIILLKLTWDQDVFHVGRIHAQHISEPLATRGTAQAP